MFAAILSLNNFFLAIFATFLGAYEQVTMLTVFRSFHCRLGLKHLSLLMTLWAISRGGLHYPRNITPIDCSQPSILSYFYSIVERTDGVAKELDASTKQKTWLGRDWEKIEAVHIFGKKGIPRFSRNGKFPLVERRQKCNQLDNGRSWLRLRPGHRQPKLFLWTTQGTQYMASNYKGLYGIFTRYPWRLTLFHIPYSIRVLFAPDVATLPI